MSNTKFSPKDPAESVTLTFDFYNLLDHVNEVLTFAAWSIEVVAGVDTSPNLLLSGSPTTFNTSSSMLLIGGIAGNSYNIHVLGTTSKNQVFKLTGSIDIKAQ